MKVAPAVKAPVARPPAEDRPAVTAPPMAEQPAVTKRPPVEERAIVPEPAVKEPPVAAAPPAMEQRPAAEPAEKAPAHTETPAAEAPAMVQAQPDNYKPITGKAAAIYNQAEEAMQAGNFSSAEMLLERALRIEPRNAHYWYILGLAKYRQKQYPQAVQFCLKAESLAGSQPGLMARNQVLLEQAKKAAGTR
jgi:tetratricopeptide (TPR) repeat protein